jgi:hypothetical protein
MCSIYSHLTFKQASIGSFMVAHFVHSFVIYLLYCYEILLEAQTKIQFNCYKMICVLCCRVPKADDVRIRPTVIFFPCFLSAAVFLLLNYLLIYCYSTLHQPLYATLYIYGQLKPVRRKDLRCRSCRQYSVQSTRSVHFSLRCSHFTNSRSQYSNTMTDIIHSHIINFALFR